MILALMFSALAGGPSAAASLDTEVVDGRRSVDTAVHVGLDVRGPNPGLAARFDMGHRFSVEGIVFAGAPAADQMKWTGGASLGLEVAPFRLQLGTQGSLDFRLGVGGLAQGRGMAKLEGAGLDFAEWAAGSLHVSPNGQWSLYAGVLAADVMAGQPEVQPRGGIRVKLD